MAKTGIGAALAKAAPPPDKLKGMPMGASEGESSPEDEDKAAKVSAMQAFMDAFNSGDADMAAEEFSRLMDICGY